MAIVKGFVFVFRIFIIPALAAIFLIAETRIADADPGDVDVALSLSLPEIRVAVPGPRNISYLPIELIKKIGADQAEGVRLQLVYTGGGAVALSHLMNRNTDFAVAGLPTQISLRTNGQPVVAVAPVDDAPSFVLMVRQALADQVKTIGDLRGRVLGVNTSSLSSQTTSQQLMELLLRIANVPLDSVRIVPAGQSWREESALLLSGAADAIMGNEPFASRLRHEGQVFFLVNLADPEVSTRIPGGNFLHAALATRQDVIDQEPNWVETMVKVLKRTLTWIATHSSEALVERLEIQEIPEREALLNALHNYRNLYSRDGRFSTHQLHETEIFFAHAEAERLKGRKVLVETQVLDRWAGRKE
ncbi:NitT/TauT family transport system substrate-binding protein [Gammaproteobacteria bacterium]